MDENGLEALACTPIPISPHNFNHKAYLPYGLEVNHVQRAMNDFIEFLGFINQQLHTKQIPRLESFLMPANFSSLVGEFMNMRIPQYCQSLVKNQYHNGHPDLIPRGLFPGDAVQYANEGVEIKGSRHAGGWQGHNPESVWLMVFHFDSNSASDEQKGVAPKPFRFLGVYGAKLEMEDWAFSGRSATSRRTITASVTKGGVAKMKANWIYRDLK
ncbi:MAG TPA: hypothetical protein PLD25_15435 [Chloroflexota bacterium]|nr:hypothetical protein [Chloroflexota bacterium]HUM72324.1 hypothetical protein [Chloroflexota bacterium]